MEDNYDFEPLNDWALVIPKAAEEKSGILKHSDESVKKPQAGQVVAVGPGRLDESMGVSKGDYIYFQQHGTVEINVNEQDLLLVNKANMMGRYTK